MTPTILTYHHVARVPADHPRGNLFVSPEEFECQMEYLKKKQFPVVSLDQIRAGLLGETSLPPKAVAISFDDGFEDNYLHAFPILKKYGFPATVFMITEKIGSRGSPDPGEEEDNCYLSPDQLREMAGAGITIGSHSATHPHLGRIPFNQADREITHSKKVLEDLLGLPVRWFCYPFGSFYPELMESVRKAGYCGAVSAIRDNRLMPWQIYCLPRVMVMPGLPLWHFRYYFSRLYHLVHYSKNRRRWRRYISRP